MINESLFAFHSFGISSRTVAAQLLHSSRRDRKRIAACKSLEATAEGVGPDREPRHAARGVDRVAKTTTRRANQCESVPEAHRQIAIIIRWRLISIMRMIRNLRVRLFAPHRAESATKQHEQLHEPRRLTYCAAASACCQCTPSTYGCASVSSPDFHSRATGNTHCVVVCALVA